MSDRDSIFFWAPFRVRAMCFRCKSRGGVCPTTYVLAHRGGFCFAPVSRITESQCLLDGGSHTNKLTQKNKHQVFSEVFSIVPFSPSFALFFSFLRSRIFFLNITIRLFQSRSWRRSSVPRGTCSCRITWSARRSDGMTSWSRRCDEGHMVPNKSSVYKQPVIYKLRSMDRVAYESGKNLEKIQPGKKLKNSAGKKREKFLWYLRRHILSLVSDY